MCRSAVSSWGRSIALFGFLFAVGSLAVGSLACGGQAEVDRTRRDAPIPSPAEPLRPLENVPDAGQTLEPPPLPPPDTDPFIESGCAPIADLPNINQCNPLSTPSDCPPGTACFPYVNYPEGPCEVETFGAACMPTGSGTQGDSCSREPCAADHICVSTGRGTQCVRLCSFADSAGSVCAPGLLCLPIDIEGFGGCL